jgi:HlyD family secretion protein
MTLGVAALLGIAWYYFRGHGDDKLQFSTVTVARGDVVQAVTATGTLNPVVSVTVGSQISGIIQSLFANFNSAVTNGQIIAQLDAATYQANVMSAEADLANSKAQLELAQLNSRRSEKLFQTKLIAQSENDQTVAALHQAEAQVQIKNAAVNRAKVDLSRCTIYAPVDGIVIDRKVDVGQTVAASMSAPVLFQIANDLTKMQINANVSEADVGSIEEGQSVTFTVDAFPSRTFPGKVTQVRNSPTTVQNVVTYDAIIEVSNPDLKLKPGMTANVSIVIAQRTGALKISNSAFRYKPADAATNFLLAAEIKIAATNAATSTAPAFTGNESPEELQKRVGEMRARGEEIPQAIREKMRGYYQSGALQRPAGGGGGRRGEGGGRGGASGGTQPSSRTVYLLVGSGGDDKLKPVTIKTGINDGAATEIIDGLKDGDKVVTAAISPNAANQPAANPFGGGGMMQRR